MSTLNLLTEPPPLLSVSIAASSILSKIEEPFDPCKFPSEPPTLRQQKPTFKLVDRFKELVKDNNKMVETVHLTFREIVPPKRSYTEVTFHVVEQRELALAIEIGTEVQFHADERDHVTIHKASPKPE